jgi:hypothetical protein
MVERARRQLKLTPSIPLPPPAAHRVRVEPPMTAERMCALAGVPFDPAYAALKPDAMRDRILLDRARADEAPQIDAVRPDDERLDARNAPAGDRLARVLASMWRRGDAV